MKVSIVDCDSYDPDIVYKAVEDAINKIGFKIPRYKKVLIKPNVLGQHKPESNITTHPIVVEAVARLFLKNDCQVIIGESSGFYKNGGTNKALLLSGMEEIAKKHKIQLVNLETVPIKEIYDREAIVYKNPQISSLIFECDLIVNLPKLKTHTLMKYTGAVKNTFGCIPGGRKQKLHVLAQKEKRFGQLLVDIYKNIKPGLNIMDAVIGLEGNGPGSAGTSKKTGLILASENACELDIVASEIIGYDPYEIYTNRFCKERGLTGQIEIVGEMRHIPYRKPVNVSRMPSWINNWVMHHAAMDPYAIKEKCIRCGVCKGICPVDAIRMAPYPKIEKSRCINCYCCHENCPHDAMGLRGSKLVNGLKKTYEILFGKD